MGLEEVPSPGSPVMRLKKRAEFVAAAKGARTERRAFVIQGLRRNAATARCEDAAVRFGFTVTKKTGNAVERNRIKRRLRAAALACAQAARPGCDYVLIARRPALSLAFSDLVAELAGGLARLDRSLTPRPSTPRPSGAGRPHSGPPESAPPAGHAAPAAAQASQPPSGTSR